MVEPRSLARLCFACGEDNPRGLGMRFELQGDRAVAQFTVPDYLQGYPGQAHGGGVATMLDEAMGWAAYGRGNWAMTAKLTMRFRAKVPLGELLTVSGWVTRERGRFLEVRAEVRSKEGRLLAEADGLFARIQGDQAEEMREIYEAWVADS
ncbi:MAG: PaaI family thioesterase [Chloroflexi bacterium]|nr:PaaI family thioesterase [Chloroflexota bacterium]